MAQKFPPASTPALPLAPWLWMVMLKPGPGVLRRGRTDVHHVPHGNQESCRSGIAIVELMSRFAPCDAGDAQSFVRSWEEGDGGA